MIKNFDRVGRSFPLFGLGAHDSSSHDFSLAYSYGCMGCNPRRTGGGEAGERPHFKFQ